MVQAAAKLSGVGLSVGHDGRSSVAKRYRLGG
jgi:hypothetical protein